MYFIHVEAIQSVQEYNNNKKPKYFISNFEPSAICFLTSVASQKLLIKYFLPQILGTSKPS